MKKKKFKIFIKKLRLHRIKITTKTNIIFIFVDVYFAVLNIFSARNLLNQGEHRKCQSQIDELKIKLPNMRKV